MRRLRFVSLLILTLSLQSAIQAQHALKIKVVDHDSDTGLPGALVKLTETLAGVADVDGLATINDIPAGTYQLEVSYLGYEEHSQSITIPNNTDVLEVGLEHHHHEMEEVFVTTNRASRLIEDVPTRVEVIGTEELEEKAVMRSNNIAMLLRESTGIQMQQTSANSASQSIRIQGLDGRYTQILKDGFPLFGGFAGSLSIMQIPPLDLQQVEVIKGSNSTLYGGGAIAGLVNLVTYKPEEDRRLRIMLDQTDAKGTTLNTFFAQKFDKIGVSLFASGNLQGAYDSNGDQYSDLPEIEAITINPAVYFYPTNHSSLKVGLNATLENRTGGNLTGIDNFNSGLFYEENVTKRIGYYGLYQNNLEEGKELIVKASATTFDRKINDPSWSFSGKQFSSFVETSYRVSKKGQTLIGGVNLYTDKFEEDQQVGQEVRDYDYTTIGAFGQGTFDLTEKVGLEAGMRFDFDKDYGAFALPKVALMTRFNEAITTRLSFGLGYKLPTIFTEEAENLTYQQILPINPNDMEAERSVGGNFDFNFKKALGENWTISLNQLFFLTSIKESLVFRNNDMGGYFFENADGPIRTRGIETNFKLTYKDFKLFANYSNVDATLEFNNVKQQRVLTPKHKLGTVLVYEKHGAWRIGYEAYYTSSQLLNNDSETQDFWTMGFMVLRKLKKVSLYINFENFTDTRQHDLEAFDILSQIKPNASQIWAPLDGRIINAGFILDL